MSPKSCGVKFMCLSSLLCLSIGPVALFYICSTLIRNYITTSHYIPTTCRIMDTNVTSPWVTDTNVTSPVNVTCECKNLTGGCVGPQSCVKLTVKYQLPQKHGGTANATLYENYEEKSELSKDKDTTCSYYVCLDSAAKAASSNVTNPSYDVIHTGSDVIHTGSDVIHTESDVITYKQKGNFTCFVNPKDSHHVLRNVPQKQEIFTGLFWPLFGIFLGLCFCIAAKICTHEKD